MTGCAHTLGVIFTAPALIIVCLQMILTAAQIFVPSFIPTRWQLFLVYQAFNLIILVGLRFGTRLLPIAMFVCIAFFFGGLFATIGLLVGYSPEKAPDSFVWKDFTNGSGFESPAMGALIGLLGPLIAFGPPHWLLNMADDIENPSRNVPIGILAQQIGNTSTLFAFYVAAYYATTNYEALLESTFASVVGALYLEGTGSKGVACALILILFVPSLLGIISYTSATVRLVYGFARGGPMGFRSWFDRVDTKYNVPQNTLYVIVFINFLLGFLYLGSAYGFAIIVNSAMAYYSLGFLPLFIPVFFNKRKYLKRGSWFQLPHVVGMVCAGFTIFFQIFCLAMFCIPTAGPLTVETFNWTLVFVVLGTVLIAVGWLIHGRHHYLVEDVIEALAVGAEAPPTIEKTEVNKDDDKRIR